MFNDNHWVLELPFLTVKVLRRLTGIREVPGMVGDCTSWNVVNAKKDARSKEGYILVI